MVVTKLASSSSQSEKGQEDPGPDSGGESPMQAAGRGHRKHLTVTMAGKKVNSLSASFQFGKVSFGFILNSFFTFGNNLNIKNR